MQGLTLIFLLVLDYGRVWNNFFGHVFMGLTRVAFANEYYQAFEFTVDPAAFKVRIHVLAEQNRMRRLADRTYKVMHKYCDSSTDEMQMSVMSGTEELFRDHGSTSTGYTFSNTKIIDVPMFDSFLKKVHSREIKKLLLVGKTKFSHLRENDVLCLHSALPVHVLGRTLSVLEAFLHILMQLQL